MAKRQEGVTSLIGFIFKGISVAFFFQKSLCLPMVLYVWKLTRRSLRFLIEIYVVFIITIV